MKDEKKIDEKAVEQTYNEQCEEALRTETPPVYVDADSCPMAARILSDLEGDAGREDGEVSYIDEDGNELDPDEVDFEEDEG